MEEDNSLNKKPYKVSKCEPIAFCCFDFSLFLVRLYCLGCDALEFLLQHQCLLSFCLRVSQVYAEVWRA